MGTSSISRSEKLGAVIYSIFVISGVTWVMGDVIIYGMRRSADWITVVCAIGLCVHMIYHLASCFRSKLILTDESVIVRSAFNKREIRFDQIDGYRLGRRGVYLVSYVASKRGILVSRIFSSFPELLSILVHRFENLDNKEIEQELNDVQSLVSREHGSTYFASNITAARRVFRIVMICSLSLGVWTVLTGADVALHLCVFLPPLTIGLARYYRGLIRYDLPRLSLTSMIWSFLGPALGLMLTAVIIDVSGDALTVAVLVVALVILMAAAMRLAQGPSIDPMNKGRFSIIATLVVLAVYSYGVVLFTNIRYDASRPVHFTTVVMEKYITSSQRGVKNLPT